ncbi:sentrin-specific protease 2-like [Corticium candelabrum]|uniref:sentrin-specific protease 2-like n=1 Tax=Corticium candelabrum TaxID=121492 RepID=UPI002E2588B3|nr:sentrin-specific protease 2-like [Corticium candelabrum]
MFEYNIVIFPIHLSVHWTVVILDIVKKELLYLDSLSPDTQNEKVVLQIREFIKHEAKRWRVFFSDQIPCKTGHTLKDFPTQSNGWDCGVFVCLYSLYQMLGIPYNFDQSHIPLARTWIAKVLIELPVKETSTDENQAVSMDDDVIEIDPGES